jgi:hypothetical protein
MKQHRVIKISSPNMSPNRVIREPLKNIINFSKRNLMQTVSHQKFKNITNGNHLI